MIYLFENFVLFSVCLLSLALEVNKVIEIQYLQVKTGKCGKFHGIEAMEGPLEQKEGTNCRPYLT